MCSFVALPSENGSASRGPGTRYTSLMDDPGSVGET